MTIVEFIIDLLLQRDSVVAGNERKRGRNVGPAIVYTRSPLTSGHSFLVAL